MSDTTATMDAADPVQDRDPDKPDVDISRLWVLCSVVAVVLLASLAYAITVAATAGRPKAPIALPTPTPAAPNWPAGDLRWLLAHAPAESTALESLGSADHTLSLDQAAAIYGDSSSSRSYLTSLGYLGGAGIAWRAGNPRYDVRISLLQFGGAAQATTWVADVQRSLGAGAIESSATLPEVPGGMWFVTTQTADVGFRIVHAVFQQGAIGVDVTFWCYPSVMPAVVTAIAAHQYARLPAA
jgi:hypothetical protein